MNTFRDIKALMMGKNGKKLAAFSVAVFLIITVIVGFAVFRLCVNINLKQMDEYLGEIPTIIDTYRNEFFMLSRVYEDDILTRAELGLKLYNEDNTLTEAKKLERIRNTISADSISILDEQRNLLFTTGHVSPKENFRTYVKILEPRSPHLELYPVISEDGKETGKNDGKGLVLLHISENPKHSLVFEFSCDTVLELYNSIGDWPGVLERMLSGRDALAFAKTGDKLIGYPLDNFTANETSRLYYEVRKIFQNSNRFRSSGNRSSSKLITLMGEHYLSVLMHYTQGNTDILLTIPMRNVIGNGIYIAATISFVIGLGIILLQIYILRRLLQENIGNVLDVVSRKWLCKKTWPGIVVVLTVIILFSTMLMLLEDRTNVTFTAITKRMTIQHEVDLYKDQEDTIRSIFIDVYRSRAQMLTEFLSDHTDYQTRAGLKELNRIAKTDYLMLFDRTGKEIISSNSYTGFSVGTNLGDEYRAVLMGYPYVVAGPAPDPYMGKIQLGTAILMTDSKGLPDGFLLAVYSAGDLNAVFKRMSYENTVNNFAVQKSHIAAVINDKDGRFIAHTDPKMINHKTEDFLEDFEPGSSFEGFAYYNGKSVCVSASAADGKTLLFMVPEREDSYVQTRSVLVALIVLLILALLYYPIASLMIARAMADAKDKLQPTDTMKSPITVFSDGYVVFLTLFAIFALIASSNEWWTSFDYIFSGRWSKGVHLFSLWAALFILSIVFCCEFLIRLVLSFLDKRINIRTKTITRLANSLIIYAASIFLIFCILDMFGVNTTALLASAGIVSIAVGMGAQSMAADLLAGFFMMLEGSVHVGDLVSVAGITGHVTDMGIRTTEITDDEGNVVILNNSKLNPVRNMSRKNTKDTMKTKL